MLARLQNEKGFGLVELLVAMTVMSIGIVALVAGFSSGFGAINRASHNSTAGTLADQQMEALQARARTPRSTSVARCTEGGYPTVAPTGSRVSDAEVCPDGTPTGSPSCTLSGGTRVAQSSSVTIMVRDGRRQQREGADHRVHDVRPVHRLEGRDMAAFTYEAINAQGLESSGVIHAPDTIAATELLQARGLLARSLSERTATGEEGLRTKFKKVKPKSLQIFARQLATMIEAGVSVVAALVTLEEQTDDKYLAETIAEVRSDVESGLVLSQALARHPKVFNRLFVSMVEAGESSGTLDAVLDRVATQIEKETQLKRRVRGAMIYPAVVLSFATLVLIFMLLFIVPVFVEVFETLDGDLPAPTKLVMGMSDLLRDYWFIIFPAMGSSPGACAS